MQIKLDGVKFCNIRAEENTNLVGLFIEEEIK